MPAIDFEQLVNPTPRQREFFAESKTHEYVLYGGAAGGGKSYVLRWWLVGQLLKFWDQGHRGVRVGMFSDTYATLHDRQIVSVKTEFPRWLGTWHEKTHEFRLKSQYGGGIIAFRNLDDPSKYASAEFAAQAIEELTLLPKETFIAINRRRRWKGIAAGDCRFAAATNPGGPGHGWVKKLWVVGDFSGEDRHFDRSQFSFVPAKLTDNPHIDKDYEKKYVTAIDRRVFVDGDWDVFAGQYFSDWRYDLHTCESFEVPPEWRQWGAVDYGTYNPFCYLQFAQDPSNGRRYVVKERYRSGLTARDQARMILEAREGDEVAYTVADPSMWQKGGVSSSRQEQMRSPADDYLEEGVVLRRAINDRVPGWNNVRTGLQLLPDGKPGLIVFRTCPHLIHELPELIHDKVKPEDIEQGTGIMDHAADALRYGVSLPGVVRPAPRKATPLYSLSERRAG